MVTESDNRIVDRYCGEILSEGDFTAADEILTPEFVIHGLETLRGRDRFLEVQSTVIREAFPDFRVDVEDVFGDGTKVAVRATVGGTHDGTYLGIEPTGRQVAVESTMICRLSDGRIAEVWPRMDSLAWFQQLGAVPPMEWQEDGSIAPERER
ncbi:ester cyclase [Halosolutus gelatinilyticus]|uniref:ester cyclase n=1 Tax=Halosolutus gelatinilyticus TaxID=2931975 RepID=UPI001FF27FF6|nr:ester cyclase [Halosolutus gelatinilyticus]